MNRKINLEIDAIELDGFEVVDIVTSLAGVPIPDDAHNEVSSKYLFIATLTYQNCKPQEVNQ